MFAETITHNRAVMEGWYRDTFHMEWTKVSDAWLGKMEDMRDQAKKLRETTTKLCKTWMGEMKGSLAKSMEAMKKEATIKMMGVFQTQMAYEKMAWATKEPEA